MLRRFSIRVNQHTHTHARTDEKTKQKLRINDERTSIDGLCSIACEVPAKSNADDAATLNPVSTRGKFPPMTKEGEFLLFCSPSFSSTPRGRVVVFERRSIGYGGSSSLSSSSVMRV